MIEYMPVKESRIHTLMVNFIIFCAVLFCYICVVTRHELYFLRIIIILQQDVDIFGIHCLD